MVVLEKTLESPLDCEDIQQIHPEGDQSWKDWCWSWNSNTLATWCKDWLIWKDPDAGKDWMPEEKRTKKDEMAGWHHWLMVHEFGWTLGAGDGQGVPACCGSWGWKESDMTEWLNWTELEYLENLTLLRFTALVTSTKSLFLSKVTHSQVPEIREHFWDGHLWGPFCLSTTPGRTTFLENSLKKSIYFRIDLIIL